MCIRTRARSNVARSLCRVSVPIEHTVLDKSQWICYSSRIDPNPVPPYPNTHNKDEKRYYQTPQRPFGV